MSSHDHRLPEPDMPESELIRSADALPDLSPGLRSATMAVCGVHIRRAQRIRRLKVAAISAVAAAAVFAVWSVFSSPSTQLDPPVAQEAVPPTMSPGWPSHVNPEMNSESGPVLSAGNAGNRTEDATPDKMMEEVQKRAHDVMDSGLIPGL